MISVHLFSFPASCYNATMEKMKKLKKFEKSKRTFSWMSPKLEVRSVPKYGKGAKGVFAKKDIKKDELLAVFGGYVMTIREEEKLNFPMNDYSLQISEDFVLGPNKIEDISDVDFFNHSCDPNAGFNGQIFLVAMRNIKKEEEITFDYAMVLCKAKNAKTYKFKCLCGKDNCRKTLSEDDWEIPELQERYDGYFQYYLQGKIDKLKNDE